MMNTQNVINKQNQRVKGDLMELIKKEKEEILELTKEIHKLKGDRLRKRSRVKSI